MGSNHFLIHMGLRIASRRKNLHWTQEQLAEKMGVSLQTVSNIELGKKRFDRRILQTYVSTCVFHRTTSFMENETQTS